ncbi:MAG: ankyrin repeat domain-containing protein [Candidatus Sericytochromatia bacterium]|nr:ankyrin repeat domain-containing protein [Candidatus Sericytochromatia bacterium]
MTAARSLLSLVLLSSCLLATPVAVAESGSDLLLAAGTGDLVALNRCLATGVSLESRDDRGNTPLIMAAQQGQKRAALVLLSSGADLEAQDENGYTPLIWAAQQGHADLVEIFLLRGANIDAREKNDYTALEWATWEGRVGAVKVLLSYGADPLRRTRWGFTAGDLARRQGLPAMVRLFTPPRASAASIPAPAAPRAVEREAGVAPTARRHEVALPSMFKEVGRSKLGAPIHLASIGQGERSVLFIGSIHGDEPQGTDLIFRMMRESDKFKPVLARNRFLAIPNANPDGFTRHIRTNLNGVDLNRNFPTRWRPTVRGRYFSGPRPLSEPESQAVMRVIENERPALIVAFHAHMACNNYDGAGAAAIARAMSRANGYRLLPFIGYETPGSLGQHASNAMGIPIVTLEVGFEGPDQLWRKVRDSLLVALEPSVSMGALQRAGAYGI